MEIRLVNKIKINILKIMMVMSITGSGKIINYQERLSVILMIIPIY
jgi:hypothetical protein